MHDSIRKMDDVSRRRFIAGAASTFLGVSVMPWHRVLAAPAGGLAAAPKAQHVIYLYLTGGMSHLDTLDPKPGAQEQGPTEAIATNVPGIQLASHFKSLAKQADKIALIRSMTTKVGAHERGQYFMRTSYQPLATIQHPALGAWAMKLGAKSNATLPGNILVNGPSQHPGAGFFDTRYAPLRIGNPTDGLQNSTLPKGVTEDRFNHRLDLSRQLDRTFEMRYPHKQVKAYTDFYQDAVRLMKSEDLAAFDLEKESQATRAAYGDDRFAQGCLLARRLVEHGVKFIEVQHGGWDTHTDNFDRIEDLAGTLDQALGALLSDLSSKGLLDKTMVVVASEFGRTPKINANQGRDHHPKVFTTLLAGGGIRGGQVYGSSDKTGFAVADNPVEIPDFNATIAWAMGLPLDQIATSPSGRPFTVAHKGQPLTMLF
ncbi:DUF1501 domain-containing protein [Planctomycetales bacterium ZRK34]|nr:DUF1501 domain-containing protein [Planctomycetales bacterium ZRK34]